MIGRLPHPQAPDDPSRCVFVPLDYDPEGGRWISLVGEEGFFYHDIDAGRVCARELERKFSRVAELSQLLRICCEHPEFRFSGDGLDAATVRKMARDLSYAVMVASDSMERLLDEPAEEDPVQMGGVMFQVNEATCLLEPVEDDGGRPLDPDRLFVRHLNEGFRRASTVTGRPVTQQGIQEAIVWLEAMSQARKGPAKGNGPSEPPSGPASAPAQRECHSTDASGEADTDDTSSEEEG